ncbi:MAG: thermonuclease family protein [Desulfotignum sp.]|jgi:endonuclease YncB( thermonuclease family)|nr:thermonuclease family protein [Desulfotignum sp.]
MKKKFIRYLIPGLVLFMLAIQVSSDVFVWTDEDGFKHFSNIAPSLEADDARILGKEIQNQISNGRSFQVLKVYDGDSLLVKGLDLTLKIRMVGIDAPETGGRSNPGQPYSKKAHLYLTRLVKDRVVTLKSYGLGGYNRILAEVFTGGTNINLEMIKMGLAEVYQGSTPKHFDAAPYVAAQTRARNNRIGMWSLGSRYKSPRQWRKENPRK